MGRTHSFSFPFFHYIISFPFPSLSHYCIACYHLASRVLYIVVIAPPPFPSEREYFCWGTGEPSYIPSLRPLNNKYILCFAGEQLSYGPIELHPRGFRSYLCRTLI